MNLSTAETEMNDCIDACLGDTNCIFVCVEMYDSDKQKCPCGKNAPLVALVKTLTIVLNVKKTNV